MASSELLQQPHDGALLVRGELRECCCGDLGRDQLGSFGRLLNPT
jgi:hypothetical protein